MLVHAVALAHNTLVCAIFMGFPTGNEYLSQSVSCPKIKKEKKSIIHPHLRWRCACAWHDQAWVGVRKAINNSFWLSFLFICGNREEVAWDIDTIYLSHDTRILNLRDFDHLEPKWVAIKPNKFRIINKFNEYIMHTLLHRDLMAIVSALEYNTFFRGLKASHTRLSNETLERILHVLRRSMWLEELHLESLGLR